MKFEITGKGKVTVASLKEVKALIRFLKGKENLKSVKKSQQKNAVSDWARSFRNKWTFEYQFQNETDGKFTQLLEIYIKAI